MSRCERDSSGKLTFRCEDSLSKTTRGQQGVFAARSQFERKRWENGLPHFNTTSSSVIERYFDVVKQYAKAVGFAQVAPHDLRRSCAKLCHACGGELEQIQFLLGHVSVPTTERYPGVQTANPRGGERQHKYRTAAGICGIGARRRLRVQVARMPSTIKCIGDCALINQ